MIDVKIYEHRLDPDTRRELIAKLTDAVTAVFGEEIRPNTWIVLTPVPAENWGIGGS